MPVLTNLKIEIGDGSVACATTMRPMVRIALECVAQWELRERFSAATDVAGPAPDPRAGDARSSGRSRSSAS